MSQNGGMANIPPAYAGTRSGRCLSYDSHLSSSTSSGEQTTNNSSTADSSLIDNSSSHLKKIEINKNFVTNINCPSLVPPSPPLASSLTAGFETVLPPPSPPLASSLTTEIFCLTSEEINSYNDKFTGATYKMGGSGKYKLENQDAMSTYFITVGSINYTMITLCDGHDIDGKRYADTTVDDLPKKICERFEQVLEDPVVIINEIFAEFIKQLRETLKNTDGGTTVTVTIFSDGCLIVANIGDCEALLKTYAPKESIIVERNGQKIQTEITDGCIRATSDHNCNNLDEVKRVLDTGAQIKYATTSSRNKKKIQPIDAFKRNPDNTISIVPHTQQENGYVNNMSYEPAIYINDNNSSKKMNMTRSIGDWQVRFLSTIPDVTKITWTCGNRARLVVGTDGYFNCFSKEDQIKELSFDYTSKIICERAYNAVENTFTHKLADNTTIGICDIPQY
jgi:serine/threonine protein phosphatase PrpC